MVSLDMLLLYFVQGMQPCLMPSKEAVISPLRRTERQLTRNPVQALIYEGEVQKVVESGYVRKLSYEDASQSSELMNE